MFYVGLFLTIADMEVGVLHSANYSATLTELCNTSVETCISVCHQIISAS